MEGEAQCTWTNLKGSGLNQFSLSDKQLKFLFGMIQLTLRRDVARVDEIALSLVTSPSSGCEAQAQLWHCTHSVTKSDLKLHVCEKIGIKMRFSNSTGKKGTHVKRVSSSRSMSIAAKRGAHFTGKTSGNIRLPVKTWGPLMPVWGWVRSSTFKNLGLLFSFQISKRP